jgi:hypothetical protein
MTELRRRFLDHWFLGVFVIIGGLWVVTLIAYASGAEGISVRNRYTGQPATIDFMREHERPLVSLGDGVALELDANGPQLRATVVKVEPGLPGLGWVCGELDTAGGLAMVTHRQGDWFFRAPSDESNNHEAVHGRRPESRAFILTLAYDRKTGERVIVEPDTPLPAQAELLAARGLAVSEDARLTFPALTDLPVVSMQREGCVIFNVAFVLVTLLWLVLGGLSLLIVHTLRSRRRGAGT